QNPQGGKAIRPASSAGDQVRVGDQPQDRQDTRPRRASDPARPRGRGDRMSNCHLVAARSLIDLAASRLALRAPPLRAAKALTRPSRSAQRAVGRTRRPLRRSAQTTSSRTIALSMVIILRITATITTFGNLPPVVRRSWNALSTGFQLLALIAAM